MDQSHTGLGTGTRLHRLGSVGNAAVVAWGLLTMFYLFVRIPLWNPAAPIISSLLLAAELFGIGSLALHIFSTWVLVERNPPSPPLGAAADLFITTWNEPVEMLRSTLLAAKAVRHAGTIWLLDDGNRKEMQKLADELEVAYLGRTDRSHAKAGNLNNALAHSKADFVAIFDCDHAPSADFLERTLGYFIDPRVGFVQTPQDFYNIDSFQHRSNSGKREVWHEQTLFYRVIQPGKDFWNSAFFCGSCAVVRTSALAQIGGFATGTITEDLHTSLKMHKRGWKSVYHTEALAFGLSPSDFDQYQTQRLRWARGAMQVWRQEGFIFARGLSLAQRLNYLASTATYFEGWQKAIVYLMPIVVILTGWLPIAWAGSGFLVLFAIWLLSGMTVNEIVSRGYAKTLWMEEYNFFRYFTFIRATLALVIPLNWGFVVTAKGKTVGTRTLVKLMPQAAIGVAALISLVLGTYFYSTQHHLSRGAFAVTIVFLAFDLILSGKALAFALRRSQQRRGSHRFPIPVPITIETTGGRVETLADDISVDGMLVSIANRTTPKEVVGTLHLPKTDLQFRSKVIRTFSDGKVALQFSWRSARECDPLTSYLYGNTLQWDLNSLSEVSAPRDQSHAALGRGRWERAVLRLASGDALVCVARPEDRDFTMWRVVVYQRPSDRLELEIADQYITGLEVAHCEAIEVGDNRIFVLLATTGQAGAAASSHRRPRWAASPQPSSALPFLNRQIGHA